MRSFSFFVLLLVLSVSGRATELTDLGHGLGYLRVHQLDQAIKPLAGSDALVLDLRHATGSAESVAAFQAALVGRVIPNAPLLVLVSPDTAPELAAVLKGNLVTLGIKGSLPEPKVIVEQTAEADRAAYDALPAGTGLAQLISGKIEKERFDEASLVQEFKNGNHDAQPPALPALRSSGSEGGRNGDAPVVSAATPATARPTDRVLQRAVHLHRALLALKR